MFLMLRCTCVMASDIQLLSAELLLILTVYNMSIEELLRVIRCEVQRRQAISALYVPDESHLAIIAYDQVLYGWETCCQEGADMSPM